MTYNASTPDNIEMIYHKLESALLVKKGHMKEKAYYCKLNKKKNTFTIIDKVHYKVTGGRGGGKSYVPRVFHFQLEDSAEGSSITGKFKTKTIHLITIAFITLFLSAYAYAAIYSIVTQMDIGSIISIWFTFMAFLTVGMIGIVSNFRFGKKHQQETIELVNQVLGIELIKH